MLTVSRAVIAAIAGLGVMTSAAAFDPLPANDLQAQFNWRLAFGGASPTAQFSYGLALGYRAQADSPVASLIELDVKDAGALARLAGLPLYERSYRADQAESKEQLGDASTAENKPWYTHSWVMWTLGGLAATAALASSGGNTEEHNRQVDGAAVQGGGTNVGSVSGEGGNGYTVCGTENVPNVPDTCTHVPGFSGSPVPGGLDALSENPRLDAAAGGMGDLIAH